MVRSPAQTRTRNLNFRLGGRRHSVDANKVVEVVRAPRLTRVPNGPASLLGIANIRGEPVPVIALGHLLGEDHSHVGGGCIIVYEQGQRIGLMVDEVLQIGSDDTATIRDLETRLEAQVRPARTNRQVTDLGQRKLASRSTGQDALQADDGRQFLTVKVAGQDFAIALADVHEVITLDNTFATAGPSGDIILGIIDYRGSVLPVAAAHNLLGLRGQPQCEGGRAVVLDYQGARVGLSVDRILAVVRLASSQIDAVPTILKRGQGPAELQAIGRLGDGHSLVAILSTERLFGNRAVHDAAATSREPEVSENSTMARGEQFLIFALGEEEYGVPIRSVDEVVRVPDTVTRVPKAPRFIKGVMNLRGRAVPLIDQRLRFEVGDTDPIARQRAVIMVIDGIHVGFVVDRVSETLEIPLEDLLPAPDISERTSVFDRVARLGADGRMILLVDPKELLTRAEQDIVTAFAKTDMEEKAT